MTLDQKISVHPWNLVYTLLEQKIRRISLPSYPFAKERYWIEKGHKEAGNTQSDETKKPHPLKIEKRQCTATVQRYQRIHIGGIVIGPELANERSPVTMRRALLTAKHVTYNRESFAAESENGDWLRDDRH